MKHLLCIGVAVVAFMAGWVVRDTQPVGDGSPIEEFRVSLPDNDQQRPVVLRVCDRTCHEPLWVIYIVRGGKVQAHRCVATGGSQ
jgi:hypothetical protein